MQFAVLGRRFKLGGQFLQLPPFLVALLNLSLQAGAQLVEQAVEPALQVLDQGVGFGTLQAFPMLAQVFDFVLVHSAGLPEQGFGLLQHLAQPFGAGIVALQGAILFVDVLLQLPEPLAQPPGFGVLNGTEVIPGGGRFERGVADCRLEFGAGFGFVAKPLQQGFQRSDQFQPLTAPTGAGLAFGQKAGARLGVAFPQFFRCDGFLLAPFLFQFGKPPGVAAALAVPAQVLHLDAQALTVSGARLFSRQVIQTLPRPAV